MDDCPDGVLGESCGRGVCEGILLYCTWLLVQNVALGLGSVSRSNSSLVKFKSGWCLVGVRWVALDSLKSSKVKNTFDRSVRTN